MDLMASGVGDREALTCLLYVRHRNSGVVTRMIARSNVDWDATRDRQQNNRKSGMGAKEA